MKKFLLGIFALSSILSLASEKKKVLLVFPQLENLGLTGKMVMGGVEMAATQYPELAKEIEFVKIEPDKNIKIMSDQVLDAIHKNHPIAIVGAITSNVALALSQLAESEKIPFITPFATHPEVTKNKVYTFRACFDDDYQAKKLSEFAAKDLQRKKAVVLVNSGNAYSMGVKNIFEKDFASLGGSVIKTINFESEKDFATEKVKEISDLKPDLILLPSYQIEAAAILSRLTVGLPKSVAYLGPDSWGGGRLFHKVFEERGAQFQGYYVQHLSDKRWMAGLPKLKKAMKAAGLNDDPVFSESTSMTVPMAIGFDSGVILFEAMKNLSTSKTLVDAIKGVSFDGITGPISFKQSNTPSEKPLFIYAINKKGEKFLKEFK